MILLFHASIFNALMLIVPLFSNEETTVTTGPSTCEIRLIPIATGAEGTILFKTFFSINTVGGSGHTPVEIGWLVASSSGVWEYNKHVYLDFDYGLSVSASDSAHLENFKAPFDFSKYPSSAEHLIKKYGVNELISENKGAGEISWTRKGMYKNGALVSQTSKVNTLFNISSEAEQGTPIKASFFHKGIALISSSKRSENEDATVVNGAVFLNGSKYRGDQVWIEVYSIDGLVMVGE